jgi:hypothetical protein
MKSIAKRILPKPVLGILLKLSDEFKSKISGVPIAPSGSDWVGYETLITFIKKNDILSVEGDLVEIGTFLGGGAYKLSKFLEKQRSSKKLYVIDIFDPTFDWTVNTDGSPMATLYRNALKVYEGKSQWEVFLEVMKECNNIVILKHNSKNIKIPSNILCFGFIDGNHDLEYVENDFYLIWSKLSSKGAVAFHDYEWDLPQTTAKMKELVNRHASEIQETYHDKNKHVLFVIKR